MKDADIFVYITLILSHPLNEQLTTNPMQLKNPKQRQQFIDTGISYRHWLLNQIQCFCGGSIYLLLELQTQNLENQWDKRKMNTFLKLYQKVFHKKSQCQNYKTYIPTSVFTHTTRISRFTVTLDLAALHQAAGVLILTARTPNTFTTWTLAPRDK